MEVVVPIDKVVDSMRATITVSGIRKFNARMNVAVLLIRLAAFIMPFNVKVDLELKP